MGRPRSRINAFETGYPGARARVDHHWHEWAMIVGDRLRRLRRERSWTLADAAREIVRPDGGAYSPGYLGKIERGVAYAPLYVYLRLAEIYGVHPSRLFAQDEVLRDVNEAELTLVRVVREAGIEPSEAIVRVLTPTRQ
jgi:transcriptional regulator with XRE-family HTH domain